MFKCLIPILQPRNYHENVTAVALHHCDLHSRISHLCIEGAQRLKGRVNVAVDLVRPYNTLKTCVRSKGKRLLSTKLL